MALVSVTVRWLAGNWGDAHEESRQRVGWHQTGSEFEEVVLAVAVGIEQRRGVGVVDAEILKLPVVAHAVGGVAALRGGGFVHGRGRSGELQGGDFGVLAEVAVLRRCGWGNDGGNAGDATDAAVMGVAGAGRALAASFGTSGKDSVVYRSAG